MNKELVNEAIEYVSTVHEFVLDKAPELVQETINYGFMSSMCALCITVPIIIACVSIMIWLFNKEDHNCFPLLIVVIPMCIGVLYPTVSALDIILKVIYSPRTYVIEKLNKL